MSVGSDALLCIYCQNGIAAIKVTLGLLSKTLIGEGIYYTYSQSGRDLLVQEAF